jgi:hypothetical protein
MARRRVAARPAVTVIDLTAEPPVEVRDEQVLAPSERSP